MVRGSGPGAQVCLDRTLGHRHHIQRNCEEKDNREIVCEEQDCIFHQPRAYTETRCFQASSECSACTSLLVCGGESLEGRVNVVCNLSSLQPGHAVLLVSTFVSAEY